MKGVRSQKTPSKAKHGSVTPRRTANGNAHSVPRTKTPQK